MTNKNKKQTSSKVKFDPYSFDTTTVRSSIRIPRDIRKAMAAKLKLANKKLVAQKKRRISMNSFMIKCFVSKVNSERA